MKVTRFECQLVVWTVDLSYFSLSHSLTHSLTQSLTHSLTHSLFVTATTTWFVLKPTPWHKCRQIESSLNDKSSHSSWSSRWETSISIIFYRFSNFLNSFSRMWKQNVFFFFFFNEKNSVMLLKYYNVMMQFYPIIGDCNNEIKENDKTSIELLYIKSYLFKLICSLLVWFLTLFMKFVIYSLIRRGKMKSWWWENCNTGVIYKRKGERSLPLEYTEDQFVRYMLIVICRQSCDSGH